MKRSQVVVQSVVVAVFAIGAGACVSDTVEPVPSSALTVDEQPIIYGDDEGGGDDRLDLYQVTDSALLRVADSTVVIMESFLVTPAAGGGYDIDNEYYGTYGWQKDLCPEERFWDQPNAGFCSGFMVGDDLIATAGHCIDKKACRSSAFVFNYAMHTDATTYPDQVGDDDVYYCDEIVGRQETNAGDYAVVRVDRPISGGTAGRAPIPIRRDSDGPTEGDSRIAGMVSVSYPTGIPVKIKGGPDPIPNLSIGGVNIQASSTNAFEVGADVSAGSSGSVLVSFDTAGRLLFVEGHLVSGNEDFYPDVDCNRMVICNYDTGCGGTWESYHRTTIYEHLVPVLDCHSSPGGCDYEVSSLGDACWDSSDTRAGGVVEFDCGPAAAERGSLHLQTRVGENPDKATLDRRLWAGGGCDEPPTGDLLSEVEGIEYTWFVASDGEFSFAAPALKLIIDTDDANGLDAAKFETIGDKILVYEPYLQLGAMMAEDVWLTEQISAGEGRWWLVDLTTGGSAGLGSISRSDLRTLDEWTTTFASADIGAAEVVSIQLGIGSYNAGLDSWVDNVSYYSANTTAHVEFADPGGICSATASASSSSVLKSTADFYERGVGTTAGDAYVRVDATDVVGATVSDKNATLDELSDEIDRAARGRQNGRSSRGRGANRVLLRRIGDLRTYADGADSGDPTDDLLTGEAAESFNRMLDRAIDAATGD